MNKGGDALVDAVSCPSAGNCSAGGFYIDRYGEQQAFVVSERNGTWDKAIEVPGSAELNQGDAWVDSVSCPSAGHCAASGTYTDGDSDNQGFVVSQT